jgi:hypothetical protein
LNRVILVWVKEARDAGQGAPRCLFFDGAPLGSGEVPALSVPRNNVIRILNFGKDAREREATAIRRGRVGDLPACGLRRAIRQYLD